MKKPTQSQLDYIEEIGIFIEKNGLSRMAGRIIGLFIVTSEPMLSLGDITRVLKISKASASTSARNMELMGVLEQVGVAGDRRDFYRIKVGLMESVMKRKVIEMEAVRKLLQKGLTVIDRESPQRDFLTEMIEDYEFWIQELPVMIEKWLRNRKKK